MTIFEYILVLLSVILGLALAQLATGVGELIRSRKAVTWSVPYVLWLVFCFCAILDVWASGWLLRTGARWNLLSVVLLLALSLSIYLAVLWLVPRQVDERKIDLGQFMLAERRYFIGILIAYCVLGVLVNLYLFPTGHFDWASYNIAGPFIVALSLGWWSPNKWVQLAVPVIGLLLFVVYFAVYFPSVG